MTTAKIAALQQIQGIQRFFKSPTVKDGTLNQRICQWIKKILLIFFYGIGISPKYNH